MDTLRERPQTAVLHVVTRYQRGGSERRIRDSIQALPEVRHHLLLGRDPDPDLAREPTGAERVEVLPTLVRQVSPANDLAALVALRRRLRSGSYAAIVTYQSKAGILAPATATLSGPSRSCTPCPWPASGPATGGWGTCSSGGSRACWGSGRPASGDPFAQGIQLAGAVHDVLIRDATMANAVSTDGKYWNGDGSNAEEQTYDIRFKRIHAAGNTDGGHDIKSQSATLVDVTAEDNKRKHRFWGNVTVQGCSGIRPNQRGGSGTQDQVHATRNAVVSMRDCTFVDDDPRTIVLNVDGSARSTVIDSRVTHAPDGRVSTVEEGAHPESPGLVVD